MNKQKKICIRGMIGSLIALIFLGLLMLAQGCSRVWLYQPSVIQSSLTADGNIVVSDAIILVKADDVKLSWQKRMQIARGVESSSGGIEAGLGFFPTVMTFLGYVPPIGTIVSGVTALIEKLVSSVNPNGRESAYLDGIKLIDDGTDTYFTTQKDPILKNKLTDAGRVLLAKINTAIYKVESVLAGRVPVETATK